MTVVFAIGSPCRAACTVPGVAISCLALRYIADHDDSESRLHANVCASVLSLEYSLGDLRGPSVPWSASERLVEHAAQHSHGASGLAPLGNHTIGPKLYKQLTDVIALGWQEFFRIVNMAELVSLLVTPSPNWYGAQLVNNTEEVSA